MTMIEHRFLRDRGAATALEPHLNPLPRSVVRGNVFRLLDGEWRFELDLRDVGPRAQVPGAGPTT